VSLHGPISKLTNDRRQGTAATSGKNLLVTGLQLGTAHITAKATDLDGGIVSQNFTVTVAASPARLADISTRAQVGSGDNVLIGGFIIQGSASKRVLVRAIGPSLIPFGVANALMDPTLELRDMNGALLFSNDNWTTATNKQNVTGTGRAPGASQESAVPHYASARQIHRHRSRSWGNQRSRFSRSL
jgi:hypothetical protein